MPMSALARDGASLIPSPIIRTFLPDFWILSISLFLSCGRSPARVWSTPISSAIASAVFSLSPVSIIIFLPISLRSLIASFDDSLGKSFTEIIPMTSLSLAKYMEVLPSPASSSALDLKSFRSIFSSSIYSRFPARYLFPAISPFRPLPLTELKLVISSKSISFS